MSEVTIVRDLKEIRKEIDKSVADYNAALAKNDKALMDAAEVAVKKSVKDYAIRMRNNVFAELRAAADPIMAAILKYEYPVLKEKVLKEDGIETEMTIVTVNKKVDLVKFCQFCKLPTAWKYQVEKLTLRLAVRQAAKLEYSKAQMQSLIDGWFLSKIEKEKEDGKNPMSNNQCVKSLQAIIDALLPDGGFKAGNTDIEFLLPAFVDVDKVDRHTLTAKKPGNMHDLVLNVLNKIVTGGSYKIKQGKVKGAQAVAEPAQAVPASDEPQAVDPAPAAEATVEEAPSAE